MRGDVLQTENAVCAKALRWDRAGRPGASGKSCRAAGAHGPVQLPGSEEEEEH